MPAPVRILLPPSEGKAAGGHGAPMSETGAGRFAALAKPRATLIRAVDKKLPTAPTLPAMQRYTGVLYQALGYASLAAKHRQRADDQIVIVSGLWGLLATDDAIPDYKLPIGTVLPKLGGLGPWWRPRLSPVLDDYVAGAVVWDLLPGAHANAWMDGHTCERRWTVRIQREAADGTRTTVSHDNKSTKGWLARAVLQHGIRDPRELTGIELPHGYRVDRCDELTGLVDVVTREPSPAQQAAALRRSASRMSTSRSSGKVSA